MSWRRMRLYAALVALLAVAGAAVAQQVRDGTTTPTTGLSGWPLAGTDGSTNRIQRYDANGNAQTYDRSKDDWQVALNIRNANGLSTDFISTPIDLRKMGGEKTLYLRWSGWDTVWVRVDAMLFSIDDSTTVFPFRLANYEPPPNFNQTLFPPATTISGWLRIIPRTQADTTGASTYCAAAIPLVDSLTHTYLASPWARLWLSTGAVGSTSNVFAHIGGRP